MAVFYDRLTDKLKTFILRQPVFFVATAPESGRVNLSPKGMDTLRILNDQRLAYLDLTGSGNETAAHLRENGRITVMFCSFTREALILRLYGSGRTVFPRDPEWQALVSQFPQLPGVRQVMVIDIASAQTSCGYGVPEMALQRERATLVKWTVAKDGEPGGIERYWREQNVASIDGLATGLLEDE